LSNFVTTWIGIAALIVGGVWAAFQYLEKVKDDRTKVTISYVERFDKPPLYVARDRITSVWGKYDADLRRALVNYEKYRHFVLSTIHKEEIEPDIVAMMDFFDELQLCVNHNVCDRETAFLFFGPHVKSFYALHYAYFEDQRKKWNDPSIGKDTEAFAREARARERGAAGPLRQEGAAEGPKK
jgi:hypothetical protein